MGVPLEPCLKLLAETAKDGGIFVPSKLIRSAWQTRHLGEPQDGIPQDMGCNVEVW